MYVCMYLRTAGHGMALGVHHILILGYIYTQYTVLYILYNHTCMHAHTVITGYFFCRKKMRNVM